MNELNKVELSTISGGESGWYYLGKIARAIFDHASDPNNNPYHRR